MADAVKIAERMRPQKVHAWDERGIPICGAKNRQGQPCQCKKLYRSGRCRFHGGLTPLRKTSSLP